MRYSSNIAQTIYVSFTDRLHVGEKVNCVGEMFGHHVQSKCEIGQTYSKFGQTMSDDRQLFPALNCSRKIECWQPEFNIQLPAGNLHNHS